MLVFWLFVGVAHAIQFSISCRMVSVVEITEKLTRFTVPRSIPIMMFKSKTLLTEVPSRVAEAFTRAQEHGFTEGVTVINGKEYHRLYAEKDEPVPIPSPGQWCFVWVRSLSFQDMLMKLAALYNERMEEYNMFKPRTAYDDPELGNRVVAASWVAGGVLVVLFFLLEQSSTEMAGAIAIYVVVPALLDYAYYYDSGLFRLAREIHLVKWAWLVGSGYGTNHRQRRRGNFDLFMYGIRIACCVKVLFALVPILPLLLIPLGSVVWNYFKNIGKVLLLVVVMVPLGLKLAKSLLALALFTLISHGIKNLVYIDSQYRVRYWLTCIGLVIGFTAPYVLEGFPFVAMVADVGIIVTYYFLWSHHGLQKEEITTTSVESTCEDKKQ
ncbi:hypothetical protein DICA1_E11716 [Diutina catenulata]